MHAGGNNLRRTEVTWQHVNLLGRKKDNPAPEESGSVDDANDAAAREANATAPKGRPTPKRSEAARKRGPVAPAPMTSSEARKRRKELGGPKLSKEERKAEKLTRRADMSERREKMMAGEDAYLLPRDKGPVRRFVRDVVDSRPQRARPVHARRACSGVRLRFPRSCTEGDLLHRSSIRHRERLQDSACGLIRPNPGFEPRGLERSLASRRAAVV